MGKYLQRILPNFLSSAATLLESKSDWNSFCSVVLFDVNLSEVIPLLPNMHESQPKNSSFFSTTVDWDLFSN